MSYLITTKNLSPIQAVVRHPPGYQDAHRLLLSVVIVGYSDKMDDTAICKALAESVASQIVQRTFNGNKHTCKQVWEALKDIISEYGETVETLYKDGKGFVGNPATAWYLRIEPQVKPLLRTAGL